MISDPIRKSLPVAFLTAITLLSAISLNADAGAISARLVSPNPFTTGTTFTLTMPRAGHVKIEVFDVRGQRIRVLLEEHTDAGTYAVPWDGEDEAGWPVLPGVYICVLSVDGAVVQAVKAIKVFNLN